MCAGSPREQFVKVVADEIHRAHMLRQVTIESFDWGSLMLMHTVEPRLRLVALDNIDFLQTGQPGKSVWLGGIDGLITDYPDRMRTILAERGFALPRRYHLKH